MKFLLPILLFLLLFFFSTSTIKAQVVINEISPSNEWVELYNTSSTEISLDECILLMGSPSQDVNFILTDTILASGYIVAEKGVTTGWTSNWLNNDGDSVSLDCPGEGNDSTSYGNDVSTLTYGRSPNGIGAFVVLNTGTKGTSNSFPIPTLTPTSQPTQPPTSIPTSTVTSTPVITKTPTPTPVKTFTPKPTKTSTPKSTESSEPEILGVTFEDSPIPTVVGDNPQVKQKLPFLPVIFIGSGVLMVGFAVYNLIRAKSLPVQN